MDDLSSKVNCSNADFRLDYADAVYQILLVPLMDGAKTDSANIKNTIKINNNNYSQINTNRPSKMNKKMIMTKMYWLRLYRLILLLFGGCLSPTQT